MLPSAQSIIIELGCLDICNRNMRKFVVKYNQMECSCKLTSCFGNKMYYFGLLAFRHALGALNHLNPAVSASNYYLWALFLFSIGKRFMGRRFV